MYTIVVPVDGSETAARALATAIDLAARIGDAELRILNVQPAIPASVGDFVGGDAIRGYYVEQAEKAFASVRPLLAGTRIAHNFEHRAGPSGETVSDYAREVGAAQIVMGTRGLSSLHGLVMGSVATRVVQTADCPVLLVK
jgi:nucleotide-binding universal stress UspA family protein